jgi:hypothetical protein
MAKTEDTNILLYIIVKDRIEQNVLHTNAEKQLSEATTDV